MIMSNCINAIRIAILKNKKGFIVPNNNKNAGLIKIFLRINIIKYAQIKNKYIVSYINYVNNKPAFKNIINMFKPGGKKYINVTELKKTVKKNNFFLILSTNRGITTSLEAINMNVGGLVLAVIWN